MKFISWNVNGLRACVQKGFLDFFNSIDADFFVFRSPSYRRDRLTLTCRAITSTGIMPRKKAIPAQPFLPKMSHYQCLTA